MENDWLNLSRAHNDTTDYYEVVRLADVVLFCLSLITMVPICFGNGLVLVAVFKFEQLYTPTNVLICSLAVADLMVGAVAVPMFAVVHHGRYGFERQEFACVLSYVFLHGPTAVSLLTLLVISIERYICIHHSFYYMKRITTRTSYLAVASLWCYIWIICPVTAFTTNRWEDTSKDDCNFGSVMSRLYTALLFTHMVVIFIITTTLHAIIARTARRHQKKMRESNVVLKNSKHLDVVRKAKIAKMLGLVLGVVYMCWLPSFLTLLVGISHGKKGLRDPLWLHLWEQVAGFIITCNSFLNPIVYAGMNRDFRRAFRHLLHLRPEPEGSASLSAAAAMCSSRSLLSAKSSPQQSQCSLNTTRL